MRPGEVLGLVGRNGAGKSTLLKILSRIIPPTAGEAVLRGRVGSLLEVGTGFHPELTGRENIYLNGVMLGMQRAEVRRKFDEIIAFAEVGEFLDTPVKRYSSGMYMRLAFAVAAHLETELLFVDEVLAVGDLAFQRKCLGKMDEVAKQGRTVILVTHNLGLVMQTCTRALLLRRGRLVQDGAPDEVVREYLGGLARGATSAFVDNPERFGNGRVRYTSGQVIDASGCATDSAIGGEPLEFVLDYVNPAGVRSFQANLSVVNQLGINVTNLHMNLTGAQVVEPGQSGQVRCRIPRVPFPPGQYRVAAALHADGHCTDHIANALVFEVGGSKFFPTARSPSPSDAAVLVDHEWSFRREATD
jgi:lipopolysaccharide transport system ATP-binding protein